MIPGFFQGPSWPVPCVRVALLLPGTAPSRGWVEFLIDTGASMTCLHPEDAILGFGIDPTKLAEEAQWPNREVHRLQHFRLVTDWVGNAVHLEVRRPTVPANPGTSP